MNAKSTFDLRTHDIVAGVGATAILAACRSIGLQGGIVDLLIVAMQSALLVALALPVISAAAKAAMVRFGQAVGMPVAAILGCVVAAIPVAILALTAHWIVDGNQLKYATLVRFLEIRGSDAILMTALLGTTLWMILCFPGWQSRLEDADRKTPLPPPGMPARSSDSRIDPPQFMKQVSPRKMGRLLFFSGERHYVRVVTDAGEDLILMRLSDAIRQARHLDGLQIHRSHWISRAALSKISRKDGRLEVTTPTGQALPVSQTYRQAFDRFVAQAAAGQTA